jgi:hypothetical protein
VNLKAICKTPGLFAALLISPKVDDPNAAGPPAVVVPANCEIDSEGLLKTTWFVVVSLGAKADLLSFPDSERLAHGQIVVPAVQPSHNTAVSNRPAYPGTKSAPTLVLAKMFGIPS